MKIKNIVAGLAVAGILVYPQTAVAWHPVGVISKKAHNISSKTNQTPVEADTTETAVEAKTGDVIRFTITVKNNGKQSSRNYNDLAFVKVTDMVPAGLEVVSDSSVSKYEYDVDTIVPGAESTRTVDMKVVANTNGQIIVNEACFTGDSTVKDKPQSGCDQARIRVVNPQTSSTSTVKPTPVVQAATTLPKTGISNVFALGTISGAVAYAVSLLHQKRRYNQ